MTTLYKCRGCDELIEDEDVRWYEDKSGWFHDEYDYIPDYSYDPEMIFHACGPCEPLLAYV